MSAIKGKLFILAVGDGESPSESFTDVAAARSNSMTINGESVDITSKSSNGWRELLEGAGITSMSMSVSGVVKEGNEALLEAAALASTIGNYQLKRGNGDTFTGPFQVTSYENAGEHNGEVTFSATLESAGVIVFEGAGS